MFGGLIPDHSRRSQALVQTIIGLARSLEIGVVAEGVETREQMEFLRRAGCDRAQGFFFHRPMARAEAENYLRASCARPGPPPHGN